MPFGTTVKFNDVIELPTAFTKCDIEATTDYDPVSYISRIKFNGTSMSYNDGNSDYAVYSKNKWADNDAKTIIVAADYTIATASEKQWWLNNTDLTQSKLK